MKIDKNILSALKDASILVVGATRSSGDKIEKSILDLHKSLCFFSQIHWLIIESDSNDDTVSKLQSLANSICNFKYKALGGLESTLPLRTQRIAHCRNVYLDELNNNKQYNKIDYVIVADLDGVNNLLSDCSLLSCWERNDWDVCTANQRGPYYDIWALRHYIWSPNDYWQHFHFLRKHNVKTEKALFISKFSRMITIPEDAEWIGVDSAFGGIAIYRKDVLKDAKYIGLTKSNEEVCEHITLHEGIIKKGGRIFINPKFINASYTEHTNELLFFPGIKKRIKRYIKRTLRL